MHIPQPCLQVLRFPRVPPGSPPATATILRPPAAAAAALNDISFCVWVKLATLRANKVLSYDLSDTAGFGLTLQQVVRRGATWPKRCPWWCSSGVRVRQAEEHRPAV